MKLTKTLLKFLHRVFNKDPVPFGAISLNCDGTDLRWTVSDGFLYLTSVGGQGQPISIDLSQYTLAQLATYIASQPGYEVTWLVPFPQNALGALVLMDSTGGVAAGVDTISGYTSPWWALMEAYSAELTALKTSVQALPDQMATTSAQGEFLDLLGSYYKVPRYANEIDGVYGPRIIATVLRPANNNVAIEMAIETYTGQVATVTDVVLRGITGPIYNGVNEHNGTIQYNAVSTNVYGLFDVTYGYDLLNGGDLTSFGNTVFALVNTLRAAGTHMRSIALTGSVLQDTLTPPTDNFTLLTVGANFADTLTPPTDTVSAMALQLAPLADSLTPPTDSATISISYNYQYGGTRNFDGTFLHQGGKTVTESLA